MALTLLEAAKRHTGDDIRSAVIELFAASTDLLRVLPFETIEGNALKYNQEASLPGIAFRGVNGSYTESTGVINPIVEQLVIAGGDVDVDKFINKTTGEGTRAAQESMKIKALGQEIGYKLVKGDSASTAKECDGLQVRLTGNQVKSNGGTSGGDPLSLQNLDEAIDRVDNPTHLLMSKGMRRLMTTASRKTTVGGFLTYERDEFGRQVMMYGDLPILTADHNADVQATLGFNEAGTGGGTTATSIYALSLGEGSMTGLQSDDMEVTDLGELQTKPTLRTRVEWYCGLALWSPRSACRLRDISNAAVTL